MNVKHSDFLTALTCIVNTDCSVQSGINWFPLNFLFHCDIDSCTFKLDCSQKNRHKAQAEKFHG